MQLDFTKVPEWFKQTSAGKQMVAEVENQTLERRRVLAQEITQLREKEAEETKLADAACAKARKVWEEVKAKLKQAEQEYGRAFQARNLISSRIDHQVSQRESELRQSASPLIADFLREIRRMEDALRNGSYTIKTGSKRNLITLKKMESFSTNVPSTLRALEACKEARAAAEGLQLEALTESELLNRLSALRASIPQVEPVAIEPEAA